MTKKKFPEGFFTKDRPIAKPRYIDADGLREYWLTNGKNERVYNTNDFLDSIDEQPTADVQPVVHAHWKYDKNGVFWCSRCECIPATKSYFCPNCGAKMDGDEHE